MEQVTAVRRSINAGDMFDNAIKHCAEGSKSYNGSSKRIVLSLYALEILEPEVAAEMTANARRCFQVLKQPQHSPKL